GGLSMFIVATAVVVGYAALADQHRGLNRVLSFKPLAGLGRISYGVYLFHIATYALLHSTRIGHWPNWVEVVIQEAASIAIAAASYLLVERRILALKARFQPLDSSTGSAPEGAVPAEEAAVPPVGRAEDGAGLVLEEPAGEVASGPVGE